MEKLTIQYDDDDDANYGYTVPIGKKPQKMQQKPKKHKIDNVRKARKMKEKRQAILDNLFEE